tara:strand:+ start:1393 stop:2622 length:1230 start_codon:yes stop_codon:yes gene_type:complete
MKIEHCRFCCSKNLHEFLDLGLCQPADQFTHLPYSESKAKKYPLQVAICSNCKLVQLNYTCSGDILYKQDYPYESNITLEGRNHWRNFANDVIKKFDLNKNDLVIDIGSNIGELLINFKNQTEIYGIDPAHNIAKKAIERGVPTLCEFFDKKIVSKFKELKLFPRVITGTNVFAHLDDVNGSLDVVKKILLPNGVFIIEVPYLLNLLKGLEYDTIYHEHLTYLSITPLNELFIKHGLEIFDVEFKDIHGGSVRVFIKHIEYEMETSPGIKTIIENEKKEKIHELDVLKKFSISVQEHKMQILSLLERLKRDGKKIAAVGAPAKGMTLLNYCEIDNNILEFVTEVSDLKKGKFCPGTDLKICSDSELLLQKIDYALILPWNFKREIMINLKDFKLGGGKFIIPLPKIEIL